MDGISSIDPIIAPARTSPYHRVPLRQATPRGSHWHKCRRRVCSDRGTVQV